MKNKRILKVKGMNHQYFTLLIWLLLSAQLFSQEHQIKADYLVRYQFTFQPDSTKTESKQTEITHLYLGKNTSFYQSENVFKFDSVFHRSSTLRLSGQIINIDEIPKPHLWHTIIKDFENDRLLFSDRVFGYGLFYETPINKMRWSIEGAEKNISGYVCTLAKARHRGRNYTACFAKDFPVSDGPYKFNGLPGLILEIYDDQHQFYFTVIDLKKIPETTVTISYNRFSPTTLEKYFSDKLKILEGIQSDWKNPKPNVINPIERTLMD